MAGLKPAEFYALTIKEFEAVIEGWKTRDRLEWERTAFLAHLIQIGPVKKPKTVPQILRAIGKEHVASDEPTKERDIKADRKYLQGLVKRMNNRGG